MNKTQILSWSVVLLVVLNLATVGTIWFQKQNRSAPQQMMLLDENGTTLSAQNLPQQMGLNTTQTEQFKRSNQKFQPIARQIILRIDSLKTELFTELQKPQSDTSRLNRLSAEVGECHTRLKQATNAYYLEMKEVCTPEQLQLLENTFTPLYCKCTHEHGKGNCGKHCSAP